MATIFVRQVYAYFITFRTRSWLQSLIFLLFLLTSYYSAAMRCDAVIKKTILNYKIDIPPEILAELRQAQEVFLDYQAAKRVIHDGSPLPTHFLFEGKKLDVISVLGVGSEGEVFIVQADGKRFVLKLFHQPGKLEENLELAKDLQTNGINVILPVSYNAKEKIALYPLIEGLDVSLVIQPPKHIERLAYVLSNRTRQLIKHHFDLFVKQLDSSNRIPDGILGIWDQNVLIDLKNGVFVVIDPL